jgi:hypothetical protein
MDTKTAQIAAHLKSGEPMKALRLASRFFDRGEDTALFKEAWDATQNRTFYAQIGKDPDALFEAACARLRARFPPQ